MGMPATLVFSRAGVSSTGQERGQNRPGRGMGEGSGARMLARRLRGVNAPHVCVRNFFSFT